MTVSVKKNDSGDEVTIAVNGRFDFSDHKEFREAYDKAENARKYVVDLSGTDYMDSAALGMLLLLREHAGGQQENVSLVGCKPEIQKILTLSNFDKMFAIK